MTDAPSAPGATPADQALRAAVDLAAVAIAVLMRGVLGVDAQGEPFTGSELEGSNVNPDAKRLGYEVGQARFVVERLPALIAELRLVAAQERDRPGP